MSSTEAPAEVPSQPIADLPSGDPIPSPSKPLPTPANTIPLTTLLAKLPSSTNLFLSRLEKCLSTPSGIDTVMLLLCYTSKLTANVLTSGRVTTLLDKSSKPVARKTLATLLAKRLNNLSALMSESRVILRLWALLGIYSWGRSIVASPTTSVAVKGLDYIRLVLCVLLQGLENGAYLSFRGVMGWTPEQQGLAYKWSARFWSAFVGIEIGKLLAERVGRVKKLDEKEEEKERLEWKKKLAKSLAWAPLTVHWSVDGGVPGISELVVGALASIPGVIQMGDLWATVSK
ncbi:putative PEX11C peroxisomal biogenesis factor 11 isoform C [Triangularia setosa]|uniref:PEX11C peroxisomal biogenesis factor 11 isoform C n=1 Tax=Triangularia setosa TaxID=2587417 RepID=A0AAN6W4V3_9PEZI|nr:putative PEX11C peroxisomal biogenesis factor 11 isoform C [Podospora setosa]